jgi:NMD protein affecting ribosome stability and mRNA decay
MRAKEEIVRIRRNIQNYEDSYLSDLKPDEVVVCRECRSVYAGQRWQLEHQAARELSDAKQVFDALCPACEKIRDRMPGGVLSLSGRFLSEHESEIVNLLHHENSKAMEVNPLERLIDIERSDDGLTVLTTTEKMAQRLGRAVHKACSGEVEYKWSEDDKLLRVNWRRDG